MGKRKLPKNYLNDSIQKLVIAINGLHKRVSDIELAFTEYIEWMKHEKKFSKHLEKKYKDKSSVQDKEE